MADDLGMEGKDIRRNLDELINRRNQISHRADRPDEQAQPPETTDAHGLRQITFAWVNYKVNVAKSVINASANRFEEALKVLENQLQQEQEQRLARDTLPPKEP
jgi:hypothetical protein